MRSIPALLAIAALALLAGCSGEQNWQTRDITGLMPPLQFTLTDENGTQVNAGDFDDKASLLFFGFTSCPDVCPTTLSRLAGLMEQMPAEEREQLQVLFVSVDPQRDSPQKLREYTDFFGPQFVGLTGTQEQLRALNKRYRVTYGYGEPDAEGFYPVSHSGAVFGFTRDGEVRVMMRESDPEVAALNDLRQLVGEG